MKIENFVPLKNYQAINWNEVSDMIDKATWEKLTEQFWLDTRIPVSNDMDDWRELDTDHQWVVGHVFGGLTLLDTLQSEAGLTALKENVKTQHETAVLNNIQFMESVHAKSYSTIFSTLNTPEEISEIFDWSDTEESAKQGDTDRQSLLRSKRQSFKEKSCQRLFGNVPVLLWLLHATVLPGSQ